jgi:WD40 repeat protein
LTAVTRDPTYAVEVFDNLLVSEDQHRRWHQWRLDPWKELGPLYTPDGKPVVGDDIEGGPTDILAIACGSDVKLYSLLHPTTPVTLSGHRLKVDRLIATPDGKTLMTRSLDNTIQVWDAGGRLLATLEMLSSGSWLVVTPHGLWDGPPKSANQHSLAVQGLVISPSDLPGFRHPGLLTELLRGGRPEPASSLVSEWAVARTRGKQLIP